MAPPLQEFPLEVLTHIVTSSVSVNQELDADLENPDHHPFFIPQSMHLSPRSEVAQTYPGICRSFYQASLPMLLEHVTLTSISQLVGLASLLASGPYLASDMPVGHYTTRLDLILSDPYPMQKVYTLLQAMPNLKILFLANKTASEERASRNFDIPNEFFLTLTESSTQLLRLQFLSDMEVPTTPQLAYLSTRLLQLRTLQITCLHPRLPSEFRYTTPFGFANLTTLSIGTWSTEKDGVLYGFLQCLIAPNALPSLRRFDILDRSCNLYAFLEAHGKYLQHLTILSGSRHGSQVFSPLSLCTQLQSITYVVDRDDTPLPVEHGTLQKINLVVDLCHSRTAGRYGATLLQDLNGVKMDNLRILQVDVELPLLLKDPSYYDSSMDSFAEHGVLCRYIAIA